jgi:hypothetical protein
MTDSYSGDVPVDAQGGERRTGAPRAYGAAREGRRLLLLPVREAADWLDRTVGVRTINSLTLKQWVDEFTWLKTLNEQIMRTGRKGASGGGRPTYGRR